MLIKDILTPITKVTPRVKRFARKISPRGITFLKPTNFDKRYLSDYAHVNVQHFIKHNGGRAQHGWLLYKFGNNNYEATFHSVVRTDDGKLVEISPSLVGADTIAFLPDNRAKADFENLLVPSNIICHRKTLQLFGDTPDGEWEPLPKELIGLPRIPAPFLSLDLDAVFSDTSQYMTARIDGVDRILRRA